MPTRYFIPLLILGCLIFGWPMYHLGNGDNVAMQKCLIMHSRQTCQHALEP